MWTYDQSFNLVSCLAATAVTPVVAGQSSAAIASACVIAHFTMGLTLKQPLQVSQAFKKVCSSAIQYMN